MDNSDYIDILNHLRRLVKESKLSDMDDMAIMEAGSYSMPKQLLANYLHMIINMLKERSGGESIFNIYDRFERSLNIEGNNKFKGVAVDLTDTEMVMSDIDKYYIHEMNDYTSAIIDLKMILEEIEMEPEPPTNSVDKGPSL